MDKLRECPFCGGEGTLFGQEDIYVYCKSCTQFCDSKEKAINNWNTRAYDAEIAELKDCYAKECSKHDELKGAYQKLFHSLAHVELYKIEAEIAELKQTVKDYEECQEDKRRLCRDIAVIILGDSAPAQPSLCDIVKYVEELKAKLDIAREAMTWQPIETAPKDGTVILGYRWISDDYWLICPMNFFLGRWVAVAFHSQNEDVNEAPTHWMPLPEPPSSLAQIEEP